LPAVPTAYNIIQATAPLLNTLRQPGTACAFIGYACVICTLYARVVPSCNSALGLLSQDDGGGGGGDGWGWERTARNLLPNIVFLGMYFAITSYGGDGWGGWGGFFGESCSLSSLQHSAACSGVG
jgi:hypothetical protein